MTGYTPGPWVPHMTIKAHDGMPECWQIDAEYDAVCTTQFCCAPNTAANARLIAAAPELLEALLEAKGLADMAEMYDGPGEPSEDQMILLALRDKINAAIAKATGADQ